MKSSTSCETRTDVTRLGTWNDAYLRRRLLIGPRPRPRRQAVGVADRPRSSVRAEAVLRSRRRTAPGESERVTQRLRARGAGIVRRRRLPPPASTMVYELTEMGAELETILMGLQLGGRRHRRSPTTSPRMRRRHAGTEECLRRLGQEDSLLIVEIRFGQRPSSSPSATSDWPSAADKRPITGGGHRDRSPIPRARGLRHAIVDDAESGRTSASRAYRAGRALPGPLRRLPILPPMGA